MSLFSFVTRPIRDLTQAVVMPFKALYVVGLTGLINASYGQDARQRFDDWGVRTQPQAAQVLDALRGSAPRAGPAAG